MDWLLDVTRTIENKRLELEDTISELKVLLKPWFVFLLKNTSMHLLLTIIYYKMLCLYLLTRIVYILVFYDTEAVNPSNINTRNCQKKLYMHVKNNVTEIWLR